MVNLTYGYLEDETTINPIGPDLISTIDGTSVAYGSGDIAWVLTCAALILLMVGSQHASINFDTRLTSTTVARSWLPLFWSHTSEERPLPTFPIHRLTRHRFIPMVLYRIQSSVQ